MKIALVCVCTLNRIDNLERFMKSISDQKSPVGWHNRVLIVDNSPDETARPTVQNWSNKNFIYKSEKRKGIVFARNKALETCEKIGADVVLFTDDDCIASPNWVRASINYLEHSKDSWVSGSIIRKNDYSFHPKPSSSGLSRKVRYGPTGNLSIKISALNGRRFSEEFNSMGGEDKYLTLTLSKSGHKGSYVRDLIVYHVERSERSSYEARVKKFSTGLYAHFLAHWRSGWKFRGVLFLFTALRFPLMYVLLKLASMLIIGEKYAEIFDLKMSKYKGRSVGLLYILRNAAPSYF